MFMHLMPVGTKMQVTVIPAAENEEAVRVRATGGCFGVMAPGNNYREGTLITAEVVDFQDGIPVFEPTAEWKMTKLPQPARVLFSTPCGVVVELLEQAENFVSYQPAAGLPEELQNLKENQKVFVTGLSKLSNGTYTAQALEPAAEEEKPRPADMMAPWTEEEIEKQVLLGSRKCWGKVRLGKVVAAEVTGGRYAQLRNGEIAQLAEGKFPSDAKRVFVRVVFITQENKVSVSLVKVNNTPELKPVSQIKNKTAVGYCDEEIKATALEQKSLCFAGPYRLGFNYRVKVKDGVPFFEPTRERSGYPVDKIDISLEDSCQAHLDDADEVVCRVNYILPSGNKRYTFSVSVLKVL